jgi:hypothetical protein
MPLSFFVAIKKRWLGFYENICDFFKKRLTLWGFCGIIFIVVRESHRIMKGWYVNEKNRFIKS